jgi:glycolate oxidase
VTLSLARFNQILKIDPLARTARVQCGVRNLAISEAAAAHGLYYAPDPSARSPAPSAATWPRTPAACTA